MVAGRDTVGPTQAPRREFPMVNATPQTASLITFAVYMLSKHPRVYDRLLQEIVDTIGTENRPTSKDLRNMKYLRAVLDGRHRIAWYGQGLAFVRVPETLRLYPPVYVTRAFCVFDPPDRIHPVHSTFGMCGSLRRFETLTFISSTGHQT